MFCVKFFTLLLFLYFIKGSSQNSRLEFLFHRDLSSFLAFLSILLCVVLGFLFLTSIALSVRSLFSFQFRLIPQNKKIPATTFIYSWFTLLLRSRISIFCVSSRWQFSRERWRQTTTGCADAPEMSFRGKVPRCWKLQGFNTGSVVAR